MGWNNQVVNLIILTEQTTGFSGIFGYSPVIGAGNLIFSVSATAGVDPYGNPYPAGLYATQGEFSGVLNAASIGNTSIIGSTFENGTITDTAITFDSSGGTLLVYATTATVQSYTSGSGDWTAPAGVTSVKAECWAGGGGSSVYGNGGGGGEYAAEYTVAVTAGNMYAYSVGAAGQAGVYGGASATNGGSTTFTGDTLTVTANGGKSGANGSSGGTGSSNSVHFPGGAGGAGVSDQTDFGYSGGGGGGAAGATGSGGNGSNGAQIPPYAGGAGGTANDGGGGGGEGGYLTVSNAPVPPVAGTAPGGGGGGGAQVFGTPDTVAANGSAGKVSLTYQTARTLVTSISGLAGTDAYGNAYPVAIGATQYFVGSVSAQPTAPASGCFLYYTGGALYAVGASNVPVKLATT